MALFLIPFWSHGLAQSMSVLSRRDAVQAVVQILAYDLEDERIFGQGSGTMISSGGFILTNAHVIVDDEGMALQLLPIFVTLSSRPMDKPELAYWAVLVDFDPILDLALLQAVLDSGGQQLPTNHEFSYAPIGTAEGLQLGDSVYIIGYPGVSGSTITFTSGVVSGFLGEDLYGGGDAWVKTDARFAPGNSGGGAFAQNGTLVGIPTLVVSRSGPGEIQELFRPIDYAYGMIERNVLLESLDVGPRVYDEVLLGRQGPTTVIPGAGNVSIRQGVRVEGSLDLLDARYFPDRLAHSFALGVPGPGGLEVTVESSDIDPYVVLLSPDGRVLLEVDDSPGMLFGISEQVWFDRSGTYTLIVTTALPGESGIYTLGLSMGDGDGSIAVSHSEVPAGPGLGKSANYSGYWSGYLLDTAGGRGAIVADLVQTGSFSVEGRWEATFSWGVTSGILVGLIQSDGLLLELHPNDQSACPFSGLAELSGYTIAGAYTAFNCSVPIAGSVSLTKRLNR